MTYDGDFDASPIESTEHKLDLVIEQTTRFFTRLHTHNLPFHPIYLVLDIASGFP